MTMRERMLNSAVLRLRRELLQRVGRECSAVTNTIRAFQAEAQATCRNPFELIPAQEWIALAEAVASSGRLSKRYIQ